MRRDVTKASDDYTSAGTASDRVTELYTDQEMCGDQRFHRATIRLAGNTTNGGIFSLHVLNSAKTTLTDAERAESEVYYTNEINVQADPVPDLHKQLEVEFTVKSGESLYMYYEAAAGDTTVSGTFRLQFN